MGARGRPVGVGLGGDGIDTGSACEGALRRVKCSGRCCGGCRRRERAGAGRGPSAARGPSAIGAGKLGGGARPWQARPGRLRTRLEERGARLELLDDHAGGREHGEAAVLELLGLHLLERLGVLGLEAEGIEVLRAKPPG